MMRIARHRTRRLVNDLAHIRHRPVFAFGEEDAFVLRIVPQMSHKMPVLPREILMNEQITHSKKCGFLSIVRHTEGMRNGSRLQHGEAWQWQIREIRYRGIFDARLQSERFRGELQ